jgi:hypothetical protein
VSVSIRIEATSAKAVLDCFGDDTFRPGMCEALNRHRDMRFTVAWLDGEQRVLDWAATTAPAHPQDWVPYDEWFNRQPAMDFWLTAFSWSVFWQAVYLGSGQLGNWSHIVENPLRPDPILGFLDVSNGYVQWDFQLEMLYRLCDNDTDAAQRFAMRWSAGHPEARDVAARLRLPDGEPLLEVLTNRARAGGWCGVTAVPVHVAARLVARARS